jgi:AAA+ ATPase superfamily predicted ATPase
MKFYNRQTELAQLEKIGQRAQNSAQLTFVVGRRRIGKTSLLLKAFNDPSTLYFFVAKKNEALLCAEFIEQIEQKWGEPVYGEFKQFKTLFAWLMERARTKNFTLIIDEFQEFQSVNAAVFSEMQALWDLQLKACQMNLICCGSVYALMTRIFENAKEPLFGRANQRMHLKAFDVATLEEILQDHAPGYSNEDLLALYLLTGGVAKYVELFMEQQATTKEAMLDLLLAEDSLFLDEGKNVLIDEFGKEYGNYFSILSLIASGKTARAEMESIMEMQIGGFLDRLEQEFGLIKKVRPIMAKPNSRSLKYEIEDHFLRFWFRFIYKNRSAIEAGNLGYIRSVVARDYATFSGKTLERFFIDRLKALQIYNQIGTYWEKQNTNEIDIVAIDDLNKHILLAEVKRNPEKIQPELLKLKAAKIIETYPQFQFTYAAYALDQMRQL